MIRLQSRDGFSVTEALVAIAVLALALLPLYQLQQNLAEATLRIDTASEMLEAERSALDYLQTINLMDNPTGELQIGEATLVWTTTEIASDDGTRGYLGGGAYSYHLLEVSATLSDGPVRREINFRRLGWRLVRTQSL